MQFITLFGSVRKLDKLARAEKHLMSFGTSPPLFFYIKKKPLRKLGILFDMEYSQYHNLLQFHRSSSLLFLICYILGSLREGKLIFTFYCHPF